MSVKDTFYFSKLCSHGGCHAWTELKLNHIDDAEWLIHWLKETDKEGFKFVLLDSIPDSCTHCKKGKANEH